MARQERRAGSRRRRPLSGVPGAGPLRQAAPAAAGRSARVTSSSSRAPRQGHRVRDGGTDRNQVNCPERWGFLVMLLGAGCSWFSLWLLALVCFFCLTRKTSQLPFQKGNSFAVHSSVFPAVSLFWCSLELKKRYYQQSSVLILAERVPFVPIAVVIQTEV